VRRTGAGGVRGPGLVRVAQYRAAARQCGAARGAGGSGRASVHGGHLAAAAQGQTLFVATGDFGADDCQDKGEAGVNVLSTSPNVTAVGGTALNPGFDAAGAATGYVSEGVWNDLSGASGGGVSNFVVRPAFQDSANVPGSFRAVLDVSLLASPRNAGYVFVIGGQLGITGGTSASAPSWAGITALLEQAAAANGMGALNSQLYALAASQYSGSGPAVFHDITTGNNGFDGVIGFDAGPGYDAATGLGTPDVDAVVHAVAAPVCAGDCNGDHVVTVDELTSGVDIALGELPLSQCPAMDANGDGQGTVDELVQALDRALNGC
jgi:hypothetical protein